MKNLLIFSLLVSFNFLTAQEFDKKPATNVIKHKRVEGFTGTTVAPENRIAAPNDIITPTGSSTELGITEGSLNVSLTGAANYSIPIIVPKGITSVEPKVSLEYSSQANNGMAGYGWNLGGYSMITRITSTQFHDGIIDPVDGDDLDRFALDGQRLILKTPSSGTYLTNGAVFETENFSNIKVTYIASTPYNYFLVEYPDGSSAKYGNNVNSQNLTTYGITQWQNSIGIPIFYDYINENNFLRINSISYGSLSSQTQINTVNFIYTARLRPEESYVNGNLIVNNKILSKITVNSVSELFREYNFIYDVTTLNGPNNLNYQRLIKITENVLDNGVSKSYNPTIFSYGNTSETINNGNITASLSVGNIDITNAETVAGDFDGDGRMDFLLYPTTGASNKTKYWIFNDNTNAASTVYDYEHNVGAFEKIFTMSMLNYPDNNKYKFSQQQGWCIVKKSGYQDTFTSYLWDPTGIFPQYSKTVTYQSPYKRNYFNGDFNGDGLTDVIAIENNNLPTSFYMSATFVNLDRRLSTNYSNNASQVLYNNTSKIYVADANGDGKSDLYVFSGGNVGVYSLNNTNQLVLLWELVTSNIQVVSGRSILMGDYNGDGKSDFLIPDADGSSMWTAYYSTGTAFAVQNLNYPDFIYNYNTAITTRHFLPNDFNNDGKTDISVLTCYSSGSSIIQCYPNKNGQFLGTAGNYYAGAVINIAGLNQNNLPFFYTSNQPNESLELGFIKDNKIYTFQALKDFGKDKLLQNITTGNGLKKVITYKPLKQGVTTNYYDPNIYKQATTLDTQYYPFVNIYTSPSMNVVSKLEQFGNNYKNQFYSYYGGVYAMNGLGLIGFQERMSTNWYDVTQPNQYMISSVSRFDPLLRGANTLNFSTINYWVNMGQVPLYCISRNKNTFNIENGTFTDPYLANKVFKLKKTKIENFDDLKNISVENNLVYNVFNNPTSVTGTIKNGSTIEQTSLTTITYDGSLLSPYTVDRPLIKANSVTAYGDTRTSQEEWSYNSSNQILTNKKKSMSSDFIVNTYDYDTYGNIKKQTLSSLDLPTTRITNFLYDPLYNGRFLTKVTDLEGLETIYTYNNAKCTLLTDTNPYGLTSTNTYDAWGKKTSVKDYLNNVATITYAKTANNTFTTTQTLPTAHGGVSIDVLDLLGRKIISGSKNIQGVFSYTKVDYDNLDRVVKKYEPYFLNAQDLYTFSPASFSQNTFDGYGRMSGITYSSGKTESISYDLLTTTVTTTADGLTTSKAATNDAIGNTINTVEAPLGGTISHQYFANGAIKSSSYSGNVITMQLDNWGRKSQMKDPSAGTYKYVYNNLGELKTEESPKGITTYSYDNFGKVLTKTVVGKATTTPPTTTNTLTTNVYDGTSKLLKTMTFNDVENNIVTSYNYNYDNKQRPSVVTETNSFSKFETEVRYDSFGRPLNQRQKSATLIAGTATINKSSEKWTTNVYQNGGLFKITDGLTPSGTGALLWQTTEVNQRGKLTKGQFGNGIFVQNTYDAVTYNLSNQNHTNSSTAGGTSYFQMSYNWSTYPQRNLYTSRTFNSNNNYVENFTFDNLNRLTSYPNELGVIENQSYAENGRIDANSNGIYNYASSIKPYKNTSIEVNPASKNYYLNSALQQINYSSLKKPISIYQETTTGVAKERIDFLYNFGESRSTMFYGDTNANKMSRKFRRYYAQGGTMEITEERDNSGNVINTDFVTFIGGDAYSAPVILKSNGTNQNFIYLHRDNLGSILAISDQNKNILERRIFDAWGNLIKLQNAAGQYVINNGQTSIANYKMILDRGYTGHEHLFGVGLINMNGRLYDPKLHRFLMPDDNLQDPSNSQNYNRYGYVLNNPLMNIDPSGEFTWSDLFAVAAIVVGTVLAIVGGPAGAALGYKLIGSGVAHFGATFAQYNNNKSAGWDNASNYVGFSSPTISINTGWGDSASSNNNGLDQATNQGPSKNAWDKNGDGILQKSEADNWWLTGKGKSISVDNKLIDWTGLEIPGADCNC